MKRSPINNIKLGAFILAGFGLLVAALFLISGSNSIFSNDIEVKARFSNIYGLQEGNNVLFSGIDAGTVKSIKLVDPQNIEVILLIKKDIILHIPANSLVSIGTEGLMGNKVVNISPGDSKQLIKEGDYLTVERKADIDEMLETLSKSNDNIASVSEALKTTAMRINSSEILRVINDKNVSNDLKRSVGNIAKTTANAEQITLALNEIVDNTRRGRGTAGLLLSDENFAQDIKRSMFNIKDASTNINAVALQLKDITQTLDSELKDGTGPLPAALRDSILTQKINESLENIRKGTDNFNQNMEALKHSFLLRGYFRKQAKKGNE